MNGTDETGGQVAAADTDRQGDCVGLANCETVSEETNVVLFTKITLVSFMESGDAR